MTNQEAIASLRTLCHTCELFPKCVHEKPECFQAIELAISALEAQEVKNSNQEVKNSSDLISRQAAIDAFCERCKLKGKDDLCPDPCTEVRTLYYVPSAQPEIIACGEGSLTQLDQDFKPNGDLISRQALCEYALNQKDKSVTPNDIMRFPSAQPEQRWIPCSDGFPETPDEVLTTYIVNGNREKRYVETATWYEGDNGFWSSPWDEYRVMGTRVEVIAWMPLPEPYKGE